MTFESPRHSRQGPGHSCRLPLHPGLLSGQIVFVLAHLGVVRSNARLIDIWIGEAADLVQGYGTQLKPLKPLRKLG